jgi:ASC-1-like (ASCH) protein
MDHLAIMHKVFLDKILQGEKTIESRFSKSKIIPYHSVKKGDRIFFKYSGGKIVSVASVKLAQYYKKPEDTQKIKDFVFQRYKDLGFNNKQEAGKFFRGKGNKNYVSFFFLDPIKLITPFKINKKGYGQRAGWISVDNISTLKDLKLTEVTKIVCGKKPNLAP